MRQFAAAWPQDPFVQGCLGQISWTHHIALLEKLDDPQTRAWYGGKAAENGWSRDEVERGLVAQVQRFLLELGEGFALVGRQHRLEVSGNEYRIDLLLYQLRLAATS